MSKPAGGAADEAASVNATRRGAAGETRCRGGEGVVLRHCVHVVHDPFGMKALPSTLFEGCRQLVVSNVDEMSWVGQLGG